MMRKTCISIFIILAILGYTNPVILSAASSLTDMSAGKDPDAGGSDKSMVLDIDLERKEVFYGESLFFSITLTNRFDEPLSVASFLDTNRSVTITLTGPDKKILKADQMSHKERDGIYVDPPRNPEGTSLAPGEKIELRGDLLQWFGIMKPGSYTLTAVYKGIMRLADSPPVKLRILPVNIASSTIAACRGLGPAVPWCASWTHKSDDTAIIFYQQQSPYLPDNPIFCINAATVQQMDVRPMAALIAAADCPAGHVYWQAQDKGLFVVKVPLDGTMPYNPVRVSLDTALAPMDGALSRIDGSIITLWTDEKTHECVVLGVDASGKTMEHRFTMNGHETGSVKTCSWGQNERLYLSWVDGSSRIITYALLDLKDMDKGIQDTLHYTMRKPVIWMDLYLDVSLTQQELRSLYLGKGEGITQGDKKPRPMIWTVSREPGSLICSYINMPEGTIDNEAILKSKALDAYTIICSVVTAKNELALLFADTSGNLYYSCTADMQIRPIRKMTRPNITLRDYPCLVKGITYDSIYLRYVSKGRSIQYLRLDYDETQAPID